MKKHISLIVAIILMLVTSVGVFAQEGTSYTGSSVVINELIENSQAGDIVCIIVTKSKSLTEYYTAAEIKSAAAGGTLNNIVEYIGFQTVDAEGKISDKSIPLSSTLPSGKCAVYINFIANNELEKIYDFEHINAGQLKTLVDLFDGEPSTYPSVFTDDNKAILGKIGAKITEYENIQNKSVFYAQLSEYSPFESNSGNLVSAFNKSVATALLCEAATPIDVIGNYNGSVWNVEISSESDFMSLSGEMQQSIVNNVVSLLKSSSKKKDEKLREMEKNFLKLTGFGLFKEKCVQRTDVENLLKDSSYAAALEIDNSCLTNGTLDDYKIASIYDYLLGKKNEGQITSYETFVKAYTDAVTEATAPTQPVTPPTVETDNGGGGGGGGSRAPITVLAPPEVIEGKSVFTDVKKEHWAFEYINNLYEKNIVSGRENGEFDPEDKVKREEFAKMIAIALNLELSNDASSYSDVKNEWYLPFINAMNDKGYINGMTQESFGVGTELKRQDAAVILNRVLVEKNIIKKAETAFTDSEKVSEYAISAVENVAGCKIFGGDNNGAFNPQSSITRAETCAIVTRLMDVLGR